MRYPLFMATALACLVASGCDRAAEQSPAEPVAAPASPTEPAVPEPAEPTDPGLITLSPDSLPTCGPPAKATVAWDARTVAGVAKVDIIAVNRAGKESLFFTGGANGSRETGAWMQSGSQLVLRNKDDGAELDRVAMNGVPCVDGKPVETAAPAAAETPAQ